MKTPRNKKRKSAPILSADLTIHSLGAQGDGIADYNGAKAYIDGALIGETITANFKKENDHIYRGHVKSVIAPSPDRIDAPCPHFKDCGGCALQHFETSAYQAWKIETVKTTLSHRGIEPQIWDKPIFLPSNTRRRTTFTCEKRGKNLAIGYNKRQSHQMLPVDTCLLLTDDINKAKSELEISLAPLTRDNTKLSLFIQQADNGLDIVLTGSIGSKDEPDLLCLETIADIVNTTDIIRFAWRANDKDIPQVLLERQKPIVQFGSLPVPLAPLAFLQPSLNGQNTLTQCVQNYMPDNISKMADLFSGCGTFTGALLSQCKNIEAFEGDNTAISMLKKSGHKNAFVRDLFRDPLTATELSAYDCAIIDPPRAGALAQTTELAKSNVKTIIAVSCNPATFARDARILIDDGYSLKHLTIVDQFIYSHHCEIVAQFIQK